MLLRSHDLPLTNIRQSLKLHRLPTRLMCPYNLARYLLQYRVIKRMAKVRNTIPFRLCFFRRRSWKDNAVHCATKQSARPIGQEVSNVY